MKFRIRAKSGNKTFDEPSYTTTMDYIYYYDGLYILLWWTMYTTMMDYVYYYDGLCILLWWTMYTYYYDGLYILLWWTMYGFLISWSIFELCSATRLDCMRWTVMDSQKMDHHRFRAESRDPRGNHAGVKPSHPKHPNPSFWKSLPVREEQMEEKESFGKELQKRGVPGNLLFYFDIGDCTTLLFWYFPVIATICI